MIDLSNQAQPYKAVVLSVTIGLFGAGLALLLGVPAPALLGSTFAISLAALVGLPMKMPSFLRNIGFTTIGCSLGAGITPDTLQYAAKWPVSLLTLTILLLVIMYGLSQILMRFFHLSKETAVLSISPGALSYSIGLAASGFGDAKVVSILQSLRLLLITLCLPLILNAVGEVGQFSADRAQYWISIEKSLLLLLTVYLLGVVGERYKVPAAFILFGMLISGLLHATGELTGKLPPEIIFIGFTLTGAVVGTRFSSLKFNDLKSLFIAAALIFALSSLLTAGVSYLMATYLEVPFGQVWIAYASGGVEAMAAMALSLDYDPAFVATHHVYRLLFLFIALPILVRYLKDKKASD